MALAARLLVALLVLFFCGQQIVYAVGRGDRLSDVMCTYSEANGVRAGERFADQGITSNAGLPDVAYGHTLEHSGGKHDPNLCPSSDECVYLHEPPGPELLTGLATIAFGKGHIERFRLVSLGIGCFSLAFLAWAMVVSVGAVRAAFVTATFAFLPMITQGMHALCYVNYQLALLELELGVLLLCFFRGTSWRITTPLLFLLGFASGWVSFDYIAHVALAAPCIWLLRGDLRSHRRTLIVCTLALGGGYALACVLHLVQVAVFLGSFHAMIDDYVERGTKRMSGQIEASAKTLGAIELLRLYWTKLVDEPQFFRGSFLATFIVVLSSLFLRTIPDGHFRVRGQEVVWRPYASLRWAVLFAFVVPNVWIVVVRQHASAHTFYIPRSFAITFIVGALAFALAFRAPAREQEEEEEREAKGVWMIEPPLSLGRLPEWLRRLAGRLDPGGPRWITVPACLVVLGLMIYQATTLPRLLIGEHDWRESDTFSVAYWFRHESADFFHPRIDWGSDHSGIMGMEAPIYSYALFLLSFVFGDEPFVGRLLNFALFWPIAWLFARRFSAGRAGAVAMLLVFATSPMALYEFRQVQPDPFMTSLLALAAVAFDRWGQGERRWIWLTLGYVAVTLAALSKTPAIVALPALWLLAIGTDKLVTKRSALLGVGFVAPALVAFLWDRWAHHLNVEYNGGHAYFHIDFSLQTMGKSLTSYDGVVKRFFARQFAGYVLSWVWFPAFIAGIPLAFSTEWRRRSLCMLAWLFFALLFCACFADRFRAHIYYGLVALLPATYFAGKGIEAVFEAMRGDAGTRGVSRPRAALGWFVVLALACTPFIGGPLREGKYVQGSGGSPAALPTWCTEHSPFWLLVLVAAAFALTRWAPGPAGDGRLVRLSATVALALAAFRGGHDGAAALSWRARLPESEATERSIHDLEEAADRLIPLSSKVLVDMESPAYLRRVRRHGYTASADTIDERTLSSYVHNGTVFLVHFGSEPAPEGAPAPLTAGRDWAIYCLAPEGCPGPHGSSAGAKPVAKPRPPQPEGPILTTGEPTSGPPMGWNTWNHFGCDIHESVVRETADAIVSSGMREAGYQYVVLDDCWASSRNADGELVADPERFPSGIPSLAAYMHERGLKLGIYAAAWTQSCKKRPGSRGKEEQDARTFASWEVDFVKEDWCVPREEKKVNAAAAYRTFHDAILESGRDMVFSVCTAGGHSPADWAPAIATMWRTTRDLSENNSFEGVLKNFHGSATHGAAASPGHYNDPDILEVGNGELTDDENRAHMSLWAISAAPLMAGNDLRDMSQATLDTLKNQEVIDVDQDPDAVQGWNVASAAGVEVWARPLHERGARAVVILNATTAEITRRVTWPEIGLAEAESRVRDLWAHADRGALGSYEATVPPHGAAMFTVTGHEAVVPAGMVSDLGRLPWIYGASIGGPVFRDHASPAPDHEPPGMSIHGVSHPHGLGVRADSDVRFALEGHCDNFTAQIGRDDSDEGGGAVKFQVWADRTKVYESGKVKAGEDARAITVDVREARTLRLVVVGRGKAWGVAADWADAALDCR